MPYYWKAENRPAINTMTLEGVVFNDNAPGDTATGQEGSVTLTGPGGSCPVPQLTGTGYLTALFDFLVLYNITALQFTRKAFVTNSGIGTTCSAQPGDDFPDLEQEFYAVEYSPDGTNWTELTSSGPITADNTYRTLSLTPNFNARYVRVIVSCYFTKPYIRTGSHFPTARVTDYRLTGTQVTVLEPPPPPDPEEEGTPASCTITLSWDAVEGAALYDLERRRPSGEWDTIYTGAEEEYADTGVESGQTYYYRARARSGDLISEWSSATVVEDACGSHWTIPPLPSPSDFSRDCAPAPSSWVKT